ncbi:MAG: molybdenum cofactor guanylyltransferase [Desulfovermiculus sp.]|nr:molybdenum cofactor guanylyltransferase [Desulfovermiculus sp.]
MLTNISGAILCGGLNTRMHGQAKSQLPLGDQTFLQRLTQTLQSVCAQTCVITRTPDDYNSCPLPVYTDIFSLRCSLSGIHAALSHSPRQHVFITACDTPLLMPAVIRLLMDKGSEEDDVVVPVINGYYEPLCAIYSQTCLPLLSQLLEAGQAKISGMYSRIRVHIVQETEIRTADPNLDSFINVNTPEDLTRLQRR